MKLHVLIKIVDPHYFSTHGRRLHREEKGHGDKITEIFSPFLKSPRIH
jgi:hypothetical protein